MQISKSNIGSIKDLILAENSHDILELPGKKRMGAAPFRKVEVTTGTGFYRCN